MLVDGNGPPTADPIVAEALTGVVNEGIVEGDLVAALPIRIGDDGPEFVVRVTESAAESHHRVQRDLGMLALAAIAIIAAAALAGILLARRLSRPIEDLRDWTGSLGEAEGVPPPHSGIDELDTLGSALASADERIRELLERERAFSSHVAHQLRTPVAAMRIAVEAELDRPRDDHREVLIESLGALDRLESTIGSMLALARSDPRELVECEVSSVVTDHSARWEPRYASAGRSIRHRGSPVWARVDITVIDHVLDVLLDNALNYGAGTVTVSTNTRRRVDRDRRRRRGLRARHRPLRGAALRLGPRHRAAPGAHARRAGRRHARPRQHLADGVPPDAAAAPLTVRPRAGDVA